MFSAKAHYGLKAMVFLAKCGGQGPVLAKEIAATQKVPVRYLELLLSQLKKARLINSNRGKLGGYFLSKSASAITVLDVITALEGKIAFISSHTKNEGDRIELAVSDFWNKAEENLINYLGETSIDDLLQRADMDEQMYYI